MAVKNNGSTPTGVASRVLRTLQKLRSPEDYNWDKDEVLDVLYWYHQLLGIVLGVVWGVVPFTGVFAFVGALAANVAGTVWFYKSLLGLDESDFGGHQELIGEGMAGSQSIFMVTWVLLYTALHT